MYICVAKCPGSFTEDPSYELGTGGGVDIHMLELLAARLGCSYMSDLKYLSSARRQQLSREIEKIAPESADLKEWNDTLMYLTNMPPASERESARLELINCLKGVAR